MNHKPNHTDILELLTQANELLDAGHISKASDLYDLAREKAPDNLMVKERLVHMARTEGDTAQAEQAHAHFTGQFKRPFAPYETIFQQYINAQDYVRAEQVARSGVHFFPDNDVLRSMLNSIEHNQNSSFNGSIRFHVDTFPRSGTHFLIDNLMDHGRIDYASFGRNIFALITKWDFYSNAVSINEAFFAQPPRTGTYLIKTHFFQHLTSKELLAEDVISIRQLTYFLDGLYSWAHLLLGKPTDHANHPVKYVDYKIKEKSPEWDALKKHFPALKDWLDSILPHEFMRYEDYNDHSNPKAIEIASAIDCTPQVMFSNYRPDPRRLYNMEQPDFDKTVADRFDPAVYEYIVNELEPYFEKFYPERPL